MGNLARVQAYQPSLLVRPHPFRAEGPKGFMLRLAEVNWFPLRELQALGVIYEPGLLLTQGLLPDAAIDPELHYIIGKQSHLLFNQPRVWNHRHARFCPHCLADDAFWRSGWELLFHDACPQHGVWLVDQCSSCGEKISWERESIVRCQCGSDLRTEEASACPESVRTVSEILIDKLQDRQHAAFPPPLEKTDVEQTQRLIRYLGVYMSSQAGRNPLKIKQAGSLTASWSVTALAAEILMDWPNAMHRSLEHIQNEVAPAEARQLGSVFGQAYHYLYRGLIGTAFNPVREAFETWLSYSWRGGLAKRNRRLALLLLDKATWVPASLARDTLGISHQRLLHLIRHGLIDGEVYLSQAGRKFVMVRRDQLDIVRKDLDGSMDMKTAGAALGLTKKRMRQVLQKLFPGARKVGERVSMPWSVPRRDVESLLSISGQLPRVSIPDEDCVSLGHIFRYWAWTAEEIVSLMDAVRRSELKPVGYLDGGIGVNGWIFQETILKAWRERSIQGYGTWLTIPQMAKLLGIKQQAAYDLINKHFIQSEAIHRQPRGGVRVHRREVERFKDAYVFGTEIAQILGVSPQKARRILADRHIHPISGPGIDDARQVLYFRNEKVVDVLAFVPAKPSDKFDLV